MVEAAIVGLGRWGKTLVQAVQGKSERIRFVHAVDAAPEKVRAFADEHRLPLSKESFMCANSKKRRRGALAMELLFALPIMLAVLLAMVEFSILLSARQQVTSAAREAARVAALGGSPTEIRTIVDRFLGPQVAQIEATLNDVNGNPLPSGEPIQVVVSVPMFRMVPELLGFIGFSLRGQELTARAVMRKE